MVCVQTRTENGFQCPICGKLGRWNGDFFKVSQKMDSIFDPHLAADVLDLGPEAGDLPHAVRYLPRGQALHNLVQLSEALKIE